jgi:catechol 2,3-dioxygenase-like lactoylglutathione lyase family enzyme
MPSGAPVRVTDAPIQLTKEQAMGIRRISHIVLYVPEPRKSVQWYNELLGVVPTTHYGDEGNPAIFTQFGASDNDDDHDLAFFPTGGGGQRSGPWNSRFEEQPPHTPKAGLYHISYQVETEEELFKVKAELERQGRIGNVHIDDGEGGFKRVYGTDPDGLLFEVSWVPSLKTQLRLQKAAAPSEKKPGQASDDDKLRAQHEQREARRKPAAAQS